MENKITILEHYRSEKNNKNTNSDEYYDFLGLTPTEANIYKIITSESQLVHFNTSDSQIELVFYDGSVMRTIEFSTNEIGKIETKFNTEKLK